MTVSLRPLSLRRLAVCGQVAERGEQVARHRLVRALGQFEAGLLGELVQVEQAVDLQLAAVQLARMRGLFVVLVLDIPDELFDQVLQGDDARRAAVLVHDDREVRAIFPHFRQSG